MGWRKPQLTRSEVAAALDVHISTVRRLEGRDLHPVRDCNGVHHFDRAEVADLAAKRGRTAKPSGEIAARVFHLLREGKSLGEIVCATQLSPVEVRDLFEQFTTPLGAPSREQREADARRADEDHEEKAREWERERHRRRTRDR